MAEAASAANRVRKAMIGQMITHRAASGISTGAGAPGAGGAIATTCIGVGVGSKATIDDVVGICSAVAVGSGVSVGNSVCVSLGTRMIATLPVAVPEFPTSSHTLTVTS